MIVPRRNALGCRQPSTLELRPPNVKDRLYRKCEYAQYLCALDKGNIEC